MFWRGPLEFNLLLEQLRQLKTADQNALDIYTELQSQTEDKKLLRSLQRLVLDEAKHVAMEKEIMAILRQEPRVFFSGGRKDAEGLKELFGKDGIHFTHGNTEQLFSGRFGDRCFDLVLLDLDSEGQGPHSKVVVSLIKKIQKTQKKVVLLSSCRNFKLILPNIFKSGHCRFYCCIYQLSKAHILKTGFVCIHFIY